MKLTKRSIIYRTFSSAGKFIFFILISGWATVRSLDLSPLGTILGTAGILVLVLGISFVWQFLVWENYDYYIDKDGINIEHGVLRRNKRNIPFKRVQNVDISRNAIQRLLDLARVNFETAGGEETEAKLRFVTHGTARKIQREVRAFKSGSEPSGSMGEELLEEKEEEPLFSLQTKELVILSLISIEWKIFGVILFLFSFLSESFAELLVTISPSLAVPIFIGVLITGWLGSVIYNFFVYFDFKLHRSEKVLEYERGLLNRSSGSIPLSKIQALSLEENPLKRLFGYSTLKVETAGYAKKTASKKGSEIAIPIAKRERALGFGDMLEGFGDISVKRIPKRARKRYVLRYSIVFGLIFSILFLFNRYIIEFPYYLSLLLVPFLIFGAEYKWRNKGFGLGDEHLFTVNGFWNRRTVIVPYYRLQNLIDTRTIFQRRWDLASLTLDTASTGTRTDSTAVDIDEGTSEHLRNEIFERFQRSLYS